MGLRHKADGQKEDSRAGSGSGSIESASQGTGKCLSLGFLICQLEVAEKVCWGKPGRYLACPWNFFCQHFYARSIFLWNLFPSTWCCLLQRSTCARPLFHFLRSPVEIQVGEFELRAGARIARWALTGAAVTGCQGTEAGEVEGVTGRRGSKKRKRGETRARAASRGQGEGCRLQGPGWWGCSAFSR